MWYLLAGLLFGVLGGMGMGGGIILIPVLTWFLGAAQQEAQGLNLLCFLPMSALALAMHLHKKQVNIPLALSLAMGGLAGSCLGAHLAAGLEIGLLRRLFGGFLLGLGAWRAICWLKKRRELRMIERKKGETG